MKMLMQAQIKNNNIFYSRKLIYLYKIVIKFIIISALFFAFCLYILYKFRNKTIYNNKI